MFFNETYPRLDAWVLAVMRSWTSWMSLEKALIASTVMSLGRFLINNIRLFRASVNEKQIL